MSLSSEVQCLSELRGGSGTREGAVPGSARSPSRSTEKRHPGSSTRASGRQVQNPQQVAIAGVRRRGEPDQVPGRGFDRYRIYNGWPLIGGRQSKAGGRQVREIKPNSMDTFPPKSKIKFSLHGV